MIYDFFDGLMCGLWFFVGDCDFFVYEGVCQCGFVDVGVFDEGYEFVLCIVSYCFDFFYFVKCQVFLLYVL